MDSNVILLFVLFAQCFGGEVTIPYAPASIRFSQANALRTSSFDDVIAAAMGYTVQSSAWGGLSVVNPFELPEAVIIVGLDGSGSELRQEGIRYSLQEDQSLLKTFASLKKSVSSRAQRPVHFDHLEVTDSASSFTAPVAPKSSSLDASKQPDASFVIEIDALPKVIEKLEVNSSVPHGGQDFYYLQFESFAHLVRAYGDDSPQVQEGKQLLRDAFDHLVRNARDVFSDKVLVVTIVLDKPVESRRQERSLLQNGETLDINIAPEFSEDYAAIFNIILFLSIALVLAIIATSVAMAFMDPGRDSIIYRMTNPRMKKDQ